jgi:hypothetical protein
MNGIEYMNFTFKHFIALTIMDILTSWYAFTHMTGLVEINPFYNKLFGIFGVLIGLIAGKIMLTIVIWVFYSAQPTDKKITDKYTINMKQLSANILCLFMSFVVLNNLYWMVR